MRRVAEIVGILIGAFISIKMGWPAPAFFVALIFFMCWLRIFSFTKSSTFNTRLFLSLGIFSLAALLAAWLLNELLASIMVNDPALLTRNVVTAFLMGTNPLRSFWIVVAALLIALILGSAFVVPTAIANGRMTYGAHNQYEGQAPQATVSAAMDIIGINKGVWVVSNGKSRIIADQAEGLEALGGPATLIVQDGNAVILEQVGQFSRVVGSGLTQLEPYERVAMVVPLTLRSEHLNIANVATSDRILIENFELWAYHRVLTSDPAAGAASAPGAATPVPLPVAEANGADAEEAAPALPPAPNPPSNGSTPPTASAPTPVPNPQGRFPFDPDILLNRVWTMSGNDWRDSVRNVVETATRDVVGRHTLEEILPLADAKRWAFREELMAAINRVTANLMGVNVTAVDFGEVRVPTDVRDSLQARQVAGWKADTAEREEREAEARARADAVHLRLLEAERAVAQRAMMLAISDGIAGVQNVDPSVLLNMRLIEALEKMAENPATKFVIPTDVLQLVERLRPLAPANPESDAAPSKPPQAPGPISRPDGDGASAGETQPA